MINCFNCNFNFIRNIWTYFRYCIFEFQLPTKVNITIFWICTQFQTIIQARNFKQKSKPVTRNYGKFNDSGNLCLSWECFACLGNSLHVSGILCLSRELFACLGNYLFVSGIISECWVSYKNLQAFSFDKVVLILSV